MKRLCLKVLHSLKSDGVKGQLLRGGLGTLTARLLSSVLASVTSLLLARLMGATQYGMYALMLAIMGILAVPAQVGLPNLVIRETAKSFASRNWAEMVGLWKWSSRTTGVLSLGIIATAGTAFIFLHSRLSEEQVALACFGGLLIPIIAMGNIRGASLRGLGRIVLGQMPEYIIRPVLVIALSLAWVGFTKNLDAVTGAALYATSALIAFVFGAMVLARAQPQELRHVVPSYRTAEWRRACLPMALLSGMSIINLHVGVVVLGALSTSADAGVFRTVMQASALLAVVMKITDTVIAPHMARLHYAGEVESLRRLAVGSARVNAALTIPIVIIVVFGGPYILNLALGPDYVAGAVPLAVILCARVLQALVGPVEMALTMTGHEKKSATGLALSAGINCMLCVALVPRFGILGAATATFFAIVTWNIFLLALTRRALGIDVSALGLMSRRKKVA